MLSELVSGELFELLFRELSGRLLELLSEEVLRLLSEPLLGEVIVMVPLFKVVVIYWRTPAGDGLISWVPSIDMGETPVLRILKLSVARTPLPLTL